MPLRFLITAGPTREMIDAVRYLSNRSSGKTGYALARAAHDAGHDVLLISGPVAIDAPSGVWVERVLSAVEMRDRTVAAFSSTDVVIATAAVADFRPAQRVEGKLKKNESKLVLELVPNPDILAELGQLKTRQTLVGFALEVQDAEAEARRKFAAKNLDLLILNGPENLGAPTSTYRLLTAAGFEPTATATKDEFARRIVDRAQAEFARRNEGDERHAP